MYTLGNPSAVFYPLSVPLFRPHLLQLARAVDELGGVSLRDDLALVGLLNEVLVALLVGEVDGVLLGLEVEAGALHVVCAGLPAHERVLPSVTLGQHVPIHTPLVAVPVAGLGGGLCGAVNAGLWSVSGRFKSARERSCVPDGSGLEVGGRARKHGSRGVEARLGAIHDSLGEW